MIMWWTVWNFNWNLDVFLTDILDICMTFFLVQLFFHQFEISVTLLFLSRSTLLFGDISVSHIAGFIDEGLAPLDDLALISRHCDWTALDLGNLFALFPHIRFKPRRLTLLQVASLAPLSVLVVPRAFKIIWAFKIIRAFKIVKIFEHSFHIIFLPAVPGVLM